LQWNYKIYRVMNDPYVIPLPQIDFVLDSSDQLLVDYVGRFESIQGDFSRLMKILDLNVNLSHQNKTAHNKYQEYYSKKTQGIVERIFQKEIAFWEYRFDNEQKPITHCSNRYLQLEECQLKVEQGKYEEAENLFHEMQKSSLSNLAMKKLAQLYYSWGRYSESLDFGLKIVDCCNEDVDSWSLIMKSAHKLDNQSIFNQALVRIRIYNELRLSSKISKKQLLKSIIKKYV